MVLKFQEHFLASDQRARRRTHQCDTAQPMTARDARIRAGAHTTQPITGHGAQNPRRPQSLGAGSGASPCGGSIL
jgi:hypothetical protein